MSLILEALRKSEAERRRGEMPDLRAELPPPAAASRAPLRRALPWIAVALVAAIVLLVGVGLRWRAPPPVPATQAVAPTTPAATERVRLQPRATVAQPASTPRIAGREAPGSRPAARAAEHAPAPAAEATPPVAGPAPEPPPPPVATTESRETSINALAADQRKALPPLQLSMHMWDPDPAKRFVILDGERYSEGDSVGPMRILRIDAGGVLFDWQGRSIRLPLR